jgi:hypothetical protein
MTYNNDKREQRKRIPVRFKSLPRLALLLFSLILPNLTLWAQSNPHPLRLEEVTVTQTIDWEEGNIILDILIPILENRSIFPINRIASERFVIDNLGQIIQDNLSSLLLNSQETLGQHLQKNPAHILALREAYKNIWHSYSQVSSNFQELSVRYTLPMYPHLSHILTNHRTAYERPIFVVGNSLNEKEFSGIVVYVQKELPLAGSFERGSFMPSLFPKIYDENLNPFFEKEMVDPQFIARWGINAYTSDPLFRLHQERAGNNPFYLSARALYGMNRTDLVISLEDIQKIISLERNKRLLKEGRIIFVLEE